MSERLTDGRIRAYEDYCKSSPLLGPSSTIFLLLINDLRHYKKALEEMSESDDDWYVGRTPMKEYARKALEGDTP